MVTVEEALKLVEQESAPGNQTEVRKLSGLIGCVLAETVHSPINMPSFRQSAMDGYALHFTGSDDTYTIVGEIPAGSSANPELKPGEAVRIFTGAAVPDSATTVIQQEIAERNGDELSFVKPIENGKNIRPEGEQIVTGDVALEAGAEINPSAVGFLASLGITEARVYRDPSVVILATGNELIPPGTPLSYGKVYESNAVMLESALRAKGFNSIDIVRVADDYDGTLKAVNHALNTYDFVLVSGGISVGDYDFVGDALKASSVREVFYKIRQKPGKPLFFGTKDACRVFALPGNPAAAMTCFYVYVLPCLNTYFGRGFQGLKKVQRRLAVPLQNNAGRSLFLKASATDEEVVTLDAQSSAMLSSFARANALIYLDAECNQVDAGQTVITYLL